MSNIEEFKKLYNFEFEEIKTRAILIAEWGYTRKADQIVRL